MPYQGARPAPSVQADLPATPDFPTASPARSVLDGETRVQIPIEEAARLLDISRWLAYKLARSGGLPTNRVGRNLYVPVAVLRRFEQGLPLAGGDAA
jgi:excisionase family DNA binding protein